MLHQARLVEVHLEEQQRQGARSERPVHSVERREGQHSGREGVLDQRRRHSEGEEQLDNPRLGSVERAREVEGDSVHSVEQRRLRSEDRQHHLRLARRPHQLSALRLQLPLLAHPPVHQHSARLPLHSVRRRHRHSVHQPRLEPQ